MTIEQFGLLADEVADEVPPEFFRKLNGGVILLEREKLHPDSVPQAPLYIMGEYCHSHAMGRHIVIYYGSFMRTFGHLQGEAMKERIRSTLFHEFRHHLESLSGRRELEIIDEITLREYKARRRSE